MNNDMFGGEGQLVKRRWRAETAHARSFAAATVTVMPCQKGSVLEAGRVKKSRSGRFLLGSSKPNVIDLCGVPACEVPSGLLAIFPRKLADA